MADLAQVCLGFPPEYALDNNAAYQEAVDDHIRQLLKLLKDPDKPLRAQGVQLLNVLDPAVNTLAYLTVLHSLLIPDKSDQDDKSKVKDILASDDGAFIREKLVLFLSSFDAIQVRFAGLHLQNLLNWIASRDNMDPSVAVKVLATAILRIDPTGSVLTTTHLHLVRIAYNNNILEPALPILDKNAVFYPGMTNLQKPRFLSDPTLPPTSYVSDYTGLTPSLKSPLILEFDMLSGLIYCSLKNWPKAVAAFQRLVSYPTRDQGVSKFMVDAYSKWVITSLLCNGKLGSLPSNTSSAAIKAYNTIGKPYQELANIFETDDAAGLREKVETNHAVWIEHGNTGLIQSVLSAYQEWQIINLQQIYAKVSISEIREQTKCAQIGDNLASDQEVETLIQDTITTGKLKGVLEKDKEGKTFLKFLPASANLSEADFAKAIAETAMRLKSLEFIFKATNERLGTSKEYIKHLSRERQKGGQDKEGDITMDFGQHIDEEDLMGDASSIGDALY